jgi:hypothetical protein
MTKNLLPRLTALVFAVSCMSAEAKLSDDPSGLRVLAVNELGQSGRAPVEYVWGNEIPSESTAPVGTLAANQSDDQVDSYYAGDGLVTIAAAALAVILLGALAVVGSALRRREARQAGRPEGWRAELMEFLEDDLANFAAVMQGVPSQPERSRPISSRAARLGTGYSQGRQSPDSENRDGRPIDAISK